MNSIIQVEHISTPFGTITAVDGVNLPVEEGEVFGVLGFNGSGKTTLVRLPAAVLAPTGGTAHIFRLRASHLPEEPHVLRQVDGIAYPD